MPLLVRHLRQWLAVCAIALTCIVGGFYFYTRHRVQNALKQVPEKIGLEIQQSAKGFTVSKSFQGHTLFKIEAGKVVQFKGAGRGELHDVEITVYGRDSGRFDRISGKDFEFDAATGDVIGKGEVQIDLETNPAGGASPDQSIPTLLKSPIYLKTTDLTFNQKTGNAHADGEVQFSVPQARGSALGLSYTARSSVLTLNSKVMVILNSGMVPVSIRADRLTLSRVPRVVVLDHPYITESSDHAEAGKLTAFLSQDNKLQLINAEGDILIRLERPDGGTITANRLDFQPGANNTIQKATFLGNVHIEGNTAGGVKASAGRTILDFVKNALKEVHADRGVVLAQLANANTGKQNFEITAPAMDFSVANGRLVRRADTSGPPRINVSSNNKSGDTTVITAGRFHADFDEKGRFAAVHGVPDSRIVSKSKGKPDRVSTGQSIDAEFERGGGIAALVQKGSFAYDDGENRASADSARYEFRDQILLLNGSSRFQNRGMTTTARTIRLNQLTGTASGEGDVKTTDISLRSPTAGRALSSPIHVTAESVTVTRAPAVALYTGNVRIWQNANSVEAPSVQFDLDRRIISAEKIPGKRVLASLNQTDAKGKIAPVAIASDHLTYSQDEGMVHLRGWVVASGGDITITASTMDCFLQPSSKILENKSLTGTTIERIVAMGDVVVTQTNRRVTGNQLVYTAAEDKFVMTGGPPSIFDAEHGKVTGVSLTLYGHDARVLVEGNGLSPAVTEIRVAR